MGIMSISQTKEAERARLQEEVERFKAEGGEIRKVPTHSEGYGYQNYRKAKKGLRSRHKKAENTFSPQAEAKKLREQEDARQKQLEEYRRKKLRGEPCEAPTPPWEQ